MRGRSRGWWLGPLLLLMAAVGSPPVRAEPQEDAVYGYTDDHGRLRYVQSLEDVPLRLRHLARRVDTPAEDPWLGNLLDHNRDVREATLYRYTGVDGRIRFTNLPESVPPSQRSSAKIDLSRVSLHSEIGGELERRLAAEHERLAQSPSCQQLRAAATRSLISAAWDEHGPLLVFGGAVALMFLITPAMLRRFGRDWARTLSMALSVFAVAGVFCYAALRSNQSLTVLKDKAAPCESGTWNALARQDGGLVKQLQLLQHLRIQQSGLEQIAQEGR